MYDNVVLFVFLKAIGLYPRGKIGFSTRLNGFEWKAYLQIGESLENWVRSYVSFKKIKNTVREKNCKQ